MNSPELSIVVPVYNVDEWLEECLKSIQNQTFTNWECILVDDGSTDWSGTICDNYSKKDKRFCVVHQENKGVSAARNVGIDKAKGKYIAFIDPDDFISENYFFSQMSKIREVCADVSVSFCRETFENGAEGMLRIMNEWQKQFKSQHNMVMADNQDVIDALLKNLFSCVCWGKIYSRELWGTAKFPIGIDLGEDMMTVPRVIASAHSAVYVPDAVYYWRQRKKSLLNGTVTEERFEKDLHASAVMYHQLCELIPDRKKEIMFLKCLYDAGCYFSFKMSNPKTHTNKSLLYRLTRDLLKQEEK